MSAELRIPDWLATPVEPDYAYDSFNVWTGAHIKYIQEPSWLLEQCIQKGGMTLVYGEPGSGKSLITIAWANILAAADHRGWMGFERRQARKVLYVVGEGQRGISGRVSAWMRSVGLDPDDDTQWPPVQWVDQAVTLWRSPGTALQGPQVDILSHVESHGIEVVILDTLATTFGGGNENQQQDMNAYLEVVTSLQALGAAVVVVHHNSKRDDEPRGSTVLKGFVDTAFMTSATIKDGMYMYGTIEQRKQKDGQPWGRKVNLAPFRTQKSLALVEGGGKAEFTEDSKEQEIMDFVETGDYTKTQVVRGVKGGSSTVSQVINKMIDEGKLAGGNYGEPLRVVHSEEVESI